MNVEASVLTFMLHERVMMKKFRLIFMALASLSLFACQAEKDPATLVPEIEEVGAICLPADIAPIKAPFAMPQLQAPKFPAREINLKDLNLDASQLVTKQIQQAIDEMSAKGGGKVIVPQGIWKSGRIHLKSNVNLHLEEGAEIHFSGDIKDYLPAVFTRCEGVEVYSMGACIYAYQQENIALTGKGKIVGPERDCEILRSEKKGGVIENLIDANSPVESRLFDNQQGQGVFLPTFVSPTDCKNVLIEGITLERTPMWNVVPVYCDGVIIRGITVRSVGIPRGDGIDIESTRNVLIEYCTLSCGDDCFTMKAGRAEDGLRVNKPTENVVVRYCLAEQGHGGITCGSETAGVIRNLYLHDCVFNGTGSGIRFKTRRNRGGGGENITYERVRMILRGDAFNWDMLGSKMYVGELAVRFPALEMTPLTPFYRNIVARDIYVESCKYFFKAKGIPESPLSGVRIENVRVDHSQRLMSLYDVDDITLKQVDVHSPDTVVEINNGKKVKFIKTKINHEEGKKTHYELKDAQLEL